MINSSPLARTFLKNYRFFSSAKKGPCKCGLPLTTPKRQFKHPSPFVCPEPNPKYNSWIAKRKKPKPPFEIEDSPDCPYCRKESCCKKYFPS